MRLLLILFFSFFLGSPLLAQSHEARARYDSIMNSTILTGDSIPHVELEAIAIMPPPQFKSRREARKYWRLVYNLKRVLPYARVVNSTIGDMEFKLTSTTTDKERRKHVKAIEDSLWNQYEPDLRKMTTKQGRLLFKLIDRESQETTYHWIEQYKGSLSAFFWQGIARIFGSNLKTGFDPNDPNDIMIDQLIKYIDLGYI